MAYHGRAMCLRDVGCAFGALIFLRNVSSAASTSVIRGGKFTTQAAIDQYCSEARPWQE